MAQTSTTQRPRTIKDIAMAFCYEFAHARSIWNFPMPFNPFYFDDVAATEEWLCRPADSLLSIARTHTHKHTIRASLIGKRRKKTNMARLRASKSNKRRECYSMQRLRQQRLKLVEVWGGASGTLEEKQDDIFRTSPQASAAGVVLLENTKNIIFRQRKVGSESDTSNDNDLLFELRRIFSEKLQFVY
ncbi:hypothetical protein GWI33_011393 [Rhynchophorus ferrugineus]|uniref:Uncharacterized protein n=1 Tax=Rhynchophorus ferrugineus TaxID=354439 RepID=A0A834IQ35_RHYFE|nr:hypothetical protein GWI33_011393 [Rhynchophorus ferrugineus]